MQATDLGKYLFYGEAQDFLGLDEGPLAQGDVVVATAPSDRTTGPWTARTASFTIVNEPDDLGLAVADGGQLVSVPAAQAETFTFVPAEGCAIYPEISLNATGEPNTGSPRYGEVEGTVDGHMHMMAFEFLGGHAHCGEPWHKFGAPYALKDCADHEPNGCAAVARDGPRGRSLPRHRRLAGLRRLAAVRLAHARVLVLPLARARAPRRPARLREPDGREPGPVRDLSGHVRRPGRAEDRTATRWTPSAARSSGSSELEDYIDAQAGGPGKGFFRIVETPFQARKAINKGKLAVIKGMEVSEPFDCGYKGILDDPAPAPNRRPTRAAPRTHIDEVLDELWDAGRAPDGDHEQVRQPAHRRRGRWRADRRRRQQRPVRDERQLLGLRPRVPGRLRRAQPRPDARHRGGPISQDEIFGNGLDAFLPVPTVIAADLRRRTTSATRRVSRTAIPARPTSARTRSTGSWTADSSSTPTT